MHPHTELDWVNRRERVPPLRRQVRGLQGKSVWQGNHRRDDEDELGEAMATEWQAGGSCSDVTANRVILSHLGQHDEYSVP